MTFAVKRTKHGAEIGRGLIVCECVCVWSDSIHDVVQPLAVEGVWGLGAMETAHWASVGKNIMHAYALFLLDRPAGIHLFVEMLRIQAMKLKKIEH